MGDAEMAILREIYADWERGDYRRTDYYPHNFELAYGSDFLDEGSFKGLPAVSEGWRQWSSQWSSWRARPLEYKPLGDRILVLIEVTGIARTTGLELVQRGANLWEFRDGRPSRLVLYTRGETALREAEAASP
jgi:ketosteroid isomerase-like protein